MGATSSKRVKVEYDVSIKWNIKKYNQLFPDQSCTGASPSPYLQNHPVPLESLVSKRKLFPPTTSISLPLRNAQIINSESTALIFQKIAMIWRISLHRGAQADEALIGIELHLVCSCKKKVLSSLRPPLTHRIQVPVNVNVSLSFLDKNDEEVYFAGTQSHTFAQIEGGESESRNGGLVFLVAAKKLAELSGSAEAAAAAAVPVQEGAGGVEVNSAGGGLKLQFGFNFINLTGIATPSTQSNLVSDLAVLLSTGNHSDFVIECGPRKFRVHKLILAMRCSYFAAMLNSGMIESDSNKLIVTNISPTILQYIIEFIYTSNIASAMSLTYAELTELIQAADLYQLDEVKYICFGLINGFLNKENAGELAVLGFLANADLKYRTTVFEYITKRWMKLTTNSDFQELVLKYGGAFFNPNPPESSSSS